MSFSTQQVAGSDEHRLLQTLRPDRPAGPGRPPRPCASRIIDAMDMGETNYLILLAADTYDVPYQRHGRRAVLYATAPTTVFQYFVCSVCPVKTPYAWS